jgi:hypothetical protein
MPASFGSGNVAPTSFPINNIKKERGMQDEHKIFMQEYDKYGNNCLQIARVLSSQIAAQIKKHAECFYKQNLKTNSAAVKQNQESLSPDGKAQVLVKHAAEQQKYQQSLSPENKAQILCKDADAYRKQCKSLPPEKKVKILETNAAAHKKQRKSLFPDDKVQMLKKNANAHKKKWEYLSPEDKDLFAKNNTAAQHIYRKSLSPVQKVQVLTINATEHKDQQKSLSPEQKGQIKSINVAAHKRKYERLPSEKKARRIEIRTEQRHEHLTDKEKEISAQIRSVAATLYEKVDLDEPTVEFLSEHFFKDPTLALAYFYCCSTDPCVAIFNNKLQPEVDGSVIWNCISNLIGSPIGQEKAMLCQETFNNLDQSHAKIAACVSCCERLLSADGQQGIDEMKIDDFPSEFLLTELHIEHLTTLPQCIVQNHIQVVNHNGTFYHLNPDLVFDVNQIVLCRVCAENPMTKDQESIAAGNDYGRLGSLKPLNCTTRNACVPV